MHAIDNQYLGEYEYPFRDFDLLDCVPLPMRILTLTSEGKPVYFKLNKMAIQNTGMPLDQILGKSAEEIFPDQFGAIATQHHRDGFKARKMLTYIHKMQLPAGLRTVQTSLCPVKTDPGEPEYLVATTMDISDQKRNEAQWLKAETVNQQIKDFTALTAHDLQGPMRRVGMFAELLSQDFKDLGDGKVQMINTIKDTAERALQQISSLLEYSSGIDTTLSDITSFDLDLMCADIFNLCDPLRNHNLTRQTANITADRTTVQIILRNLVAHAIKHNYPESIALHVKVGKSKSHPGQLVYTLSDDGDGDVDDLINDEPLEFHESEFGLKSIQRLLISRGGSLSLTASKAGLGAVARFTLPGKINESS